MYNPEKQVTLGRRHRTTKKGI